MSAVARATFTVYSNDTGKEVEFVVDNPSDEQLKLIGQFILVTRIATEELETPHRASCHGPIGEIQCSGSPDHR